MLERNFSRRVINLSSAKDDSPILHDDWAFLFNSEYFVHESEYFFLLLIGILFAVVKNLSNLGSEKRGILLWTALIDYICIIIVLYIKEKLQLKF